jgi:hypothetical protein
MRAFFIVSALLISGCNDLAGSSDTCKTTEISATESVIAIHGDLPDNPVIYVNNEVAYADSACEEHMNAKSLYDDLCRGKQGRDEPYCKINGAVTNIPASISSALFLPNLFEKEKIAIRIVGRASCDEVPTVVFNEDAATVQSTTRREDNYDYEDRSTVTECHLDTKGTLVEVTL